MEHEEREERRRKLRKGHKHWKTGQPCNCGFVTHLLDVPEKPEGGPPGPEIGDMISKTIPEDRWNF